MVLDLLLIGLAITLEPFPVTAFILILSAQKGTIKGLAFILGWLARASTCSSANQQQTVPAAGFRSAGTIPCLRLAPRGAGYASALPSPCRASCSSFSPSLDSEVFSTVPPYLLIASTALSGVTFSTMRNSAEVPGVSMPRTWS